MKVLVALLSTAGLAGVANAHVLVESQSLFDQLFHQLVGLHHLPVMLVIGLLVWLVLRAKRDSS
jgi:hydrogenase/urease accessory protein HupE